MEVGLDWSFLRFFFIGEFSREVVLSIFIWYVLVWGFRVFGLFLRNFDYVLLVIRKLIRLGRFRRWGYILVLFGEVRFVSMFLNYYRREYVFFE